MSAAIAFLDTLVSDLEQSQGQEFEKAEARGLLGRAYKQVYVHIGRAASGRAAASLNAAIKYYLGVYDSDPKEYRWHGINTAALLIRAQADHVAIDGIADPGHRGGEIAEAVLDRISDLWENRQASMWDSGTAMEACLALERHDEAREWLKRYVREPQADAFEIGSTLRQMEEVWRLDVDTEPGASILPILRSELLQKEGGAFTVEAKQLRPGGLAKKKSDYLEKVFGSVRYHSYQFMLLSIDRARAVARIEHAPGQGYGTGFLVPAAELDEKLGDDYLLVTNAHVVSNDPNIKDALNPEDAIVTFQLLCEEGLADKEYFVSELIWTSPPWKLDASILRLNSVPEGVKSIPVHPRLPLPDGEQRVYVIGHPKGGSLSFSIQDNLLLDHESPYLHYRAPTEGGSSGSPVFNVQWKLIGLHHAGSRQMQKLNGKEGTYEANEGIWIQAVRDSLARELPAEQ
jgi:S1-C subfamily serine protease